MIRRLIALCGVLTLLAALGCGNRGPLYLPQAEPDAQQASDREEEK